MAIDPKQQQIEEKLDRIYSLKIAKTCGKR